MKPDLFEGTSLCVVGNINRDIRTEPLPKGEYLFADGETATGPLIETIGGGGANSACTAAALGARVGFLGKVGADILGERLEQTLRKRGVEPVLMMDQRIQTGSTLALAFEGGTRHFVSWLPNNRDLRPDDLDLRSVDRYAHLLRADIWFSDSMLFEGNDALLSHARHLGIKTSIDLNWDPCWGRAPESVVRQRKNAVRKVLHHVNVAHGNVRELQMFADAPDLDTALARLMDWGVESVVVHLGSEGAALFQEGILWKEPPVEVQTHLQSAGTGDVLSACMMLLDQKNIPVQERLQLSNRIVSEYIEGRHAFIPVLV